MFVFGRETGVAMFLAQIVAIWVILSFFIASGYIVSCAMVRAWDRYKDNKRITKNFQTVEEIRNDFS